jgi:hypothetical protein
MASDTQIDERLRAAEEAIAILQKKVDELAPLNWIEAVSGSMKDEPEFDEVLRLGRLMRQADRPDTHPDDAP